MVTVTLEGTLTIFDRVMMQRSLTFCCSVVWSWDYIPASEISHCLAVMLMSRLIYL
jgi:hypothetical protein